MADQNSMSSGSSFGGGSEDSHVGRLISRHHLATEREVEECLNLQKQMASENENRSLVDILVEKGYCTETQIRRIAGDLDQKPNKQQIPGYRLLGKLGKGAMATVYKARQVSLDRIVAIKVLPKRLSENHEFVDRFYREGKAAARLNHRNIVQAIDVNEAAGFHYFVMEYVDGTTVHDQLAAHKRYREKEAIELMIQIADALNHAHQRGLIHRDVKPKNIMLTTDGVAKLADMGLARDVSDTRLAKSEAGRAYGTPYYIAPEQIRGEVDIDFRADIYSLGATFYHMVTGRVPFDGPNPTAVMLKHLREPLTPPDHLNPELSIGSAEIIEVMLAKNREERYHSTQELLEDLRAVKEGNPPIHAKAIFDMSALADLEDGGVSEGLPASPLTQTNEAIAKWKTAAFVLGLLLCLSVMINIIVLILR